MLVATLWPLPSGQVKGPSSAYPDASMRPPPLPHSGVSLDSFQKKMTVQSLTYEGLQRLGPSVAKMAEVEGLDAHRRAVTLRLGIP